MAVLQDFRYGLRATLQSPVSTLVAVVALALGIGVNSSSFIAIDSMVLHPFPFPNMGRIMSVSEIAAKSPEERDPVSPGNFLDWKQQNRSFAEVAAYRLWTAKLGGNNDSASVRAAHVSAGFFALLGMGAKLGRTLTADDEVATSAPAVVVSEGFWRQHLGGSPNAPGKQILLNGATFAVVGVMPAEFDYPLSSEIWAPLLLTAADENQRTEKSLQVLGLLKAGVSAEQAGSDANQIGLRLEHLYPKTNLGRSMQVASLLSVINEVTDKFLWLLLGAATMVLLLACANVMNMQLARAARREKEIAVRAALGASRFQLARQLAAESIWMALAGGVMALFLAGWSLDVNMAQIPAEAFAQVPGLRSMRIDSTVVAYTFAVSVLAGLLACLPAIFRLLRQRSLTDLNEALQAGGRASDSSATAGRNRLQAVLIVCEVALAMVLLVGATLMVKGFKGLLTGQYGYEARNILRMQISPPAGKYAAGAPVIHFYDRALATLHIVPGVQAAAVWIDGPEVTVNLEGRAAAKPDAFRPEIEAVSSEFLSAMHMPLLEGRFLSVRDGYDSQRVAVVSQAVARQYWPSSNPIGQRIQLGNFDSPWVTVVGVSGDIVRNWLTNHPSQLIYVPYAQMPLRGATFVLRTIREPQTLVRTVQDRIHALDRDVPISGVESMESYLFKQMSGVQAAANSMRGYAIVALTLAATGIFGVISFFVAQRTRDIGVRMALGASTRDVLEMTVRQTLIPSLIGIGLGLTGAYFLSSLMACLLGNFLKLDIWTFLLCAISLLATACLASYLPARRATMIDPLIALRES